MRHVVTWAYVVFIIEADVENVERIVSDAFRSAISTHYKHINAIALNERVAMFNNDKVRIITVFDEPVHSYLQITDRIGQFITEAAP